MNKICKDYIHEVKSLFPVLGKEEKAYIEKLKSNLEDYCAESEVKSKEDLYKSYSSPAQVVTDYFSTADTEYLVKKIRFSKFIKWAVIAILSIAVVLTATYGIHMYLENQEMKQSLDKVVVDMESALSSDEIGDALNDII